MKKIRYIITSLIVLSFIACTEDDAAFPVTLDNTIELAATITTAANISSPGEGLAFTVTLPQTFSESAIVTVQALAGGIYESTARITIPPSELTGSGIISMPSAGPILLGEENQAVVSVKGVRLVTITTDADGNEVVTNSDNDTFEVSSNSIDVTLLSLVGVNLTVDWTGDASVDIDFALINLDTFDFPAGNIFSATLNKPENLRIENSNADLIDGNYAILYQSYSTTTGAVDITASVYDSSGISLNTYSVTAASIENPLVVSGGWFLANTFLNATRTTDTNGTVTWTFTLP